MKAFIKRQRPICSVIVLAVLFLFLGTIALDHSTTESVEPPMRPAPVLAGPPVSLPSTLAESVRPQSSNPVVHAFINALPDSDGTSVLVSVSGIRSAGNPIVLNVDPGTGPARHIGSYAMSISSTAFVATAIGFDPEQDIGIDGDDTMNVTTTVGSAVVSSGDVNFQRAFVETSQAETISVDNGAFALEMPNLDTFAHDVYIVVMSTNATPTPLPIGYRLVGSAYSVRSSHSLTESDKLMTLNLSFEEPLPGDADPHTLTIVGCNAYNNPWDTTLVSDLFDNRNEVILVDTRLRIYALVTSPTWRDSFQSWSLTGVSELVDVQWGPGGTLILSSSAISGTVTSIPITATSAAGWDTLHLSGTTTLSTSITVDVLDLNDNVVLADVNDGADLSGLSLAAYPGLKLRATLARAGTAVPTPKLHEWQVGWVPREYHVHLPLIVRDE